MRAQEEPHKSVLELQNSPCLWPCCAALQRQTFLHLMPQGPSEGFLEEGRGADFPWIRYLDSSPGMVRQELHRARDSRLCWVPEQEIQFCWVDFFIHQKYL